MSKVKSPPQSIRLSRPAINVLDDISTDLGGLSRRGAMELLCRFAKLVRDKSGTTYSELLVQNTLPPTADREPVYAKRS